ncbi:MAG: glycosyltransferase family 4 protein [Sandaracinaceae bacterium]
MRALLIAPSWPPEAAQNGVVSYVSRIAPALAGAGVDVGVLAAYVAPEHAARAARDGVACSSDERNTVFHYLTNKLRRRVDAYDADANHVAWRYARAMRRLSPFDVYELEEAYGYGATLLPWARARQVVRLHGPWFLCAPALGLDASEPEHAARIDAEGASIRVAHALSAPSAFALDAVRERYGLALAHARVIPNATPVVTDARRWSRAKTKPRSILFVGRFDRLKGADVVLEAFARIHAREPRATLDFVGPDRGMPDGAGGTRDFDAFVARSLPASARAAITNHGALPSDRIAEMRARAELTVVASRFETFGMTLIEAMAAGSPVLASRAGAYREILANEACFYDTEDPAALAEAALARFADPASTDALADRARLECARRFAPDVIARDTAELYRAALRHR